VLTTEDLYQGMALQPRLRLGGRDLAPADAKTLAGDMQKVLAKLVLLAETAYGVPLRPPPPPSSPSFRQYEPWYEPWNIPFASHYDGKSLGAWIHENTSSNPRSKVRAAIRYGFANDMAIDVDKLSLLAMLTHIAGGGFGRYWDDTEVYRCENGNQALAAALGQRLWESCPLVTILRSEVVTAIATTATEVTVTSRPDGGRGAPRDSKFDYLVLAVPSTVWSDVALSGWQLPQAMQAGPAVKYLTYGIDSRYWLDRGFAPSGDDDQFGQLWESTDNQMGGANIGLTVFAGGPYAVTALKQNPDSHFLKGMEQLLPGAKMNVKPGLFMAWPNAPHIKTGYCAPGLGEVTGLQRQMQEPFGMGKQVFLAGEEVCAPFFGFMEGALQSGIKAAERVCKAAGISLPAVPKVSTSNSRSPVRRKCREAGIA